MLFASLRRRLAPELRILVSGGARLSPRHQERLEAWGWTVLVGYGLAETASVFTCFRPALRRIGSAGTAIGGGEIRIADPDPDGIGEIELRGPQITAGYLNNPEANANAFTADGWFRTGDLGRLEMDGSLTVTGRTKEMIVLGGGKNLNPEELESRYTSRLEIEEIAILEHQGSLVAIVRPNVPAVRAFGAKSARDGIRVVLAEQGQGQRPYERLVGFVLTDQPLPKTRLGKYQRFKLPALYQELYKAVGGPPEVQLTKSDLALLGNPVAATFWDVLRERFPNKATSMAKNPHLDLNLDSFGWMELSIDIEHRLGAPLSEGVIANAETLRDLIEAYMATDLVSRAAEVSGPAGIFTDVEYWLRPTGGLYTFIGVLFFGLNWCLMRALFRLRSVGREHLPKTGAFIIAPNHVSDLDAFAICGVLPLVQLRRTYWAGDIKRLFESQLQQIFSRIAHVFPVGDGGAMYPIKAAITVLRSGRCLGWFPEGWRSPDGTLQAFMPGIGIIMRETDAPVIPTYITGAAEALPRGQFLPSFRQITVVFGRPATFSELEREGEGNTVDERIADGLRKRMITLGQPYGVRVA
jgi:long-chain acyl-CoA synthetase